MGHGVTKGVVDDKFIARTTELEECARTLANQFRTLDNYRPWTMPKVFVDDKRDVLDVSALDEPSWNRNTINYTYSEQVMGGPGSQGGTVGDLIGMKWQADFMAVEERAFRTRHASYSRCAAFMHGRLQGHGKENRGVFSFLRDGVKNFIEAGRAHGAEDSRERSNT